MHLNAAEYASVSFKCHFRHSTFVVAVVDIILQFISICYIFFFFIFRSALASDIWHLTISFNARRFRDSVFFIFACISLWKKNSNLPRFEQKFNNINQSTCTVHVCLSSSICACVWQRRSIFAMLSPFNYWKMLSDSLKTRNQMKQKTEWK